MKLIMNDAEILAYLDGAIDAWRLRRDGNTHSAEQDTARCYVDAYQSARKSLFGKLKEAAAENSDG